MHKIELGPGPGKSAPRWIRDLLDYDPRHAVNSGKNLLIDPAPQFRPVGHPLRKGPLDCQHTLVRKDSQSTCPTPNVQPDPTTRYEIASHCSICRHHFLITVDYRAWQDGQTPCNLQDPNNPLHHLRPLESKIPNGTEDKYNEFLEAHRFACTGATCPVIVEAKIIPPRISKDMLDLVTDHQRVIARGEKVIQAEPERFEGWRPLLPIQVLGNLRTYLQDAKVDKAKRKIDARNKKFILGLGNDCEGLVKHLDFLPVWEESSEGPQMFWTIPEVDDRNHNFIDDAQVELDMQLLRRPDDERRKASLAKIVISYPSADVDIQRSLGCYGYPTKSRSFSHVVEDVESIEHPHYASLGALETFTDDLISWAYDRQCECDPQNKPYYLDCLLDISTGRKSSDLELKATTVISTGQVSLKDITQAYAFFGIKKNHAEGDNHIIGVYKSRIESAPRQKDEARNCLLTIAKDRGSKAIEAVANDRSMTYEEALEYLSVTSDTASDSIEAAAIALSFEGDKVQVGRALRAIANKRGNDYTLQRAATAMESGNAESNLDVGEAYNRLQINDRTAPDDTVLAYYQSLSNGAPAGSSDSYTEAFKVIAHDRQSSYLLRKLDDPNADVQAEGSSPSQPVGLDNIGNTCYLNSLLQYYYTVKAVREVVMNFEHIRMPLDDESIKKKRVGGRAVIVDELHDLFENLKTASTRSIKPTRELAELTIFSSAAEANFRRASISSPSEPPKITSISHYPVYGPQGPPTSTLPYFPPPPTSSDDDIEMVDRPGEKDTEAADDSSEGTLVDLDPLPSYSDVVGHTSEAVEKLTDIKGEDSSGTFDDAVMVNGDNMSPPSELIPAAPEKPPPIPPRNKAGLSIQTNEPKDTITDDDLWKFGSQQDVTEVIGNVMFRLQCAIKPTSIDPVSGEQIDRIRDTFYGANASYIRKSAKLEKKIEPWANLIVFPDENKSRDIYEALDVVFDEQEVSIDGADHPQYASITKLPPILQIQIQRTRYDNVKHTAYKNRNAVVFPETIYLDRYMDSEDSDSTLMRRRQEAWKWKAHIQTLEERQRALGEEKKEEELSVSEALSAVSDITKGLQEMEDFELDPTLPGLIEDRLAQITQEIERNNDEIRQLKQKRNEQFTNMRKYEYKLQTVFIHRGEAGGGHYWIYIYDFENDIWREYNDEYVTEVKDRRRIFEHTAGGAGGTPYYLGYVRSADVKDLVGAVHREVKEVQMPDVTSTNSWANQLEDGVAMEEDGAGARHVEHVEPRAILPKEDWEDKAGAGAQWYGKQQGGFDQGNEMW
ncbi:ubiquitin carboxyl-terminal hydrolase protein [Rutstroemia sp. NJR-2017a WRK4]|nr:ubiquitin carboxyl-terminal hydrolase protein [Rutstroemia sp. NJR-2017a WRK4]